MPPSLRLPAVLAAMLLSVAALAQETTQTVAPSATEAVVEVPVPAPLPAAIEWAQDFEAALTLAAETGKPIMAAFGTRSCIYCARMDREVLPTPEAIRESLGFICVRVDADKRDDLVTRYKAFRYPAYLFLDPAGEVLYQSVGYLPAAPFAARMRLAQAIYKAAPELSDLQVRRAAGELSGAELARLGTLLRQAARHADAREVLTEALAALPTEAPEAAEAALDLAIVNLRTERIGARTDLATWLASHPEHPRRWEARYERGLSEANAGSFYEGLSTFTQVANAVPETDTGIMAEYYASLLSAEINRAPKPAGG